MSNLTDMLLTITTAIIGVAILAVLVSKKSNTVGVLSAGSAAFANSLGMAMSPVTGTSYSLNTGYSQSGLGGVGALPAFGGWPQM